MARADLHVHSCFSDRPSEWVLQRIGTAESYTKPEDIYTDAKSRGMDFVTITDHNSIAGALELKRAHPDDVIVGAEVTTYFPDDGCKVHLLLWGIDEHQFDLVSAARHDVFALRELVRDQDIAHSVAHATFAINNRLRPEHLEKLVLLFDNFEVMNGARTHRQNDLWRRTLDSITPTTLARLCRAHGIEPYGERPWDKGFTGGSDDHAGLLVGRCWTEASAITAEEFLARIRSRKIRADGRHNDYRTLAFAIYKIACDFSRTSPASSTTSLLSTIGDTIFAEENGGGRRVSMAERLKFMRLRTNPLGSAAADLLETLRDKQPLHLEERLDVTYESIASLTDELLLRILESAHRHLRNGDIASLVADASSAVPAILLATPFLSTLNVLNRGRGVAEETARRLGMPESDRAPRVLWFTDTLDDANGVSVTLRQMAQAAAASGHTVRLVTCSTSDAEERDYVLSLPSIFETPLPFYDRVALRVPSILRAMREIQEYEPDEVVVSTPGPIGLLGVLAAHLLDVRCRAVYHTDFAAQLSEIGGDESPVELVDAYVRWFYGLADEVLAPTSAYAEILREQGMLESRLGVFNRGIDTRRFSHRPVGRFMTRKSIGLGEAPALLYVGRLSREKGLRIVIEALGTIREHHPGTNLVLVGDGPMAPELEQLAAGVEGIVLTGFVAQDELPTVYSAADLFVFPSATDTFGMAVLEAQACGLPAVVSAAGGPREVIEPGRSGSVVAEQTPEAWAETVIMMLDMLRDDPVRYERFSHAARRNAECRSWSVALDELFGPSARSTRPRDAERNSQTLITPYYGV